MKKYEVIVSDKAKQMLGQHMRFLAELSEEAALRVTEEILRAIRSLEFMPERCPFIADRFLPPNRYRKMVVLKHYLLLYQVRDGTVYVDYLVDCRQDYRWLLD